MDQDVLDEVDPGPTCLPQQLECIQESALPSSVVTDENREPREIELRVADDSHAPDSDPRDEVVVHLCASASRLAAIRPQGFSPCAGWAGASPSGDSSMVGEYTPRPSDFRRESAPNGVPSRRLPAEYDLPYRSPACLFDVPSNRRNGRVLAQPRIWRTLAGSTSCPWAGAYFCAFHQHPRA